MRAKEFGTWLSGKMVGGRRKSGDEYNKSFKGEWPPKRYEEYASSSMEEYHSYPEIKDERTEQEQKQNDATQSNQKQESKKTKKQQRSPGQLTRNLIGRVVAVSTGAIVVANSYVALGGELPFPVPFSSLFSNIVSAEDVVASETWEWSEDFQTVTVKLLDEKGELVKEILATVLVEQKDATCTANGSKTYTATAEDGETVYSDTHTEVLTAIGHSFDAGKIVQQDDGTYAMVKECIHCHEKITTVISVEEND